MARARSATCAAFRSCVGVSDASPKVEELRGGDGVGGVQAEIADQRGDARARAARATDPADRTRMGQSQLSRKSAMRSSPGLSTRGLATRGCESRGAHALDRGPQAIKVEIIERDAGRADGDGGFQLSRRPDQQMESWGLRSVSVMASARTDGPHDRAATSRDGYRALRFLQPLHSFAPHLIQQRTRARTASLSISSSTSGKLVRRIAQPSQLLAQECRIQAAILRGAQRASAERTVTASVAHAPFGFERLRPRALSRAPLTGCLRTGAAASMYGRSGFVQIRIVRAPDQIAAADAR